MCDLQLDDALTIAGLFEKVLSALEHLKRLTKKEDGGSSSNANLSMDDIINAERLLCESVGNLQQIALLLEKRTDMLLESQRLQASMMAMVLRLLKESYPDIDFPDPPSYGDRPLS